MQILIGLCCLNLNFSMLVTLVLFSILLSLLGIIPLAAVDGCFSIESFAGDVMLT